MAVPLGWGSSLDPRFDPPGGVQVEDVGVVQIDEPFFLPLVVVASEDDY